MSDDPYVYKPRLIIPGTMPTRDVLQAVKDFREASLERRKTYSDYPAHGRGDLAAWRSFGNG